MILVLILIIFLETKYKGIKLYSVLFALANCFGLVFVIIALGYTIVDLPRYFLNKIINTKMIEKITIENIRYEKNIDSL